MTKLGAVAQGLKAMGAFFEQFKVKRTLRRTYDYRLKNGQLQIKHEPSGTVWAVIGQNGDFTFNQLSKRG